MFQLDSAEEQGGVKYDPKVIQTFADRLYKQAWQMVFTHAIAVGGIPAAILYLLPPTIIPDNSKATEAIVAALIGGSLGALIGWGKAFALRLQAQQALCQMRIEENTRNLLKKVVSGELETAKK